MTKRVAIVMLAIWGSGAVALKCLADNNHPRGGQNGGGQGVINCNPPYALGDRVELLLDIPGDPNLSRGNLGTVSCLAPSVPPIFVIWDNWSGGHDGLGFCVSAFTVIDSGWFVNCNEIAPACDAGFSGGLELQNWASSGIAGGTTEIIPAGGASGSATFAYDVDLGGGGVSFRTATFSAAAPYTGNLSFDYDYSGDHAFTTTQARLHLFADSTTGTQSITLVDISPAGAFNQNGDATITIEEGFDFGFIVGGAHQDGNSLLHGELTISNVNRDIDNDTVADGCDICLGDDFTGDTDGDGICDDLDFCLGNNLTGDSDGDGVCDDLDLCQGDDATGDSDSDGICDDLDACPGFDDNADSDSDGVCDGLDACPGFDDNTDNDSDFVPDGCDLCSVIGDINCDGMVNLIDQALLAGNWLAGPP
jgi:hypothetical protein